MTRQDYLSQLRAELKKENLRDVEEIISEYEEHFAFKLADGFSEEEIIAKLGAPQSIAAQFMPDEKREKNGGRKAVTVTGLVLADLFVGMFFVLLYAWEAIMAVVSIALATLGVLLIFGGNIYSLIPTMPYFCGLIFALAAFSLAVLSVAGSIYFAAFVRQLMRSFGRFHHNAIAAASGKPVLPSLPSYPQLSGKVKRRLRKTALLSLSVFAVLFVVAMIVCALSANALGFWHAWGWFVN